MKYKVFALILILTGVCVESFPQKRTVSRKNPETKDLKERKKEITTNVIAEDTLIQVKIEVPQDRIDTLYYDRNRKVIRNKTFAGYYRFALYPADSLAPRRFKTYYISGEPESEGNFIRLDENDDSKSLFDGEILSYFKNGNIHERLFYSRGIQEGEHTVYYQNGNIKEHSTLSQGKKNGILSSFTEDGKVCTLTIYEDDTPSDYYVVTDMNGNYSKYDSQTNKVIFETPATDEIKREYKNGVAWPYYNKNGLIVGSSLSLAKDIGKYHKIGIFIVNKSMINVELDPGQIEISYAKKGKKGTMELMPANEYDQRVYKKKKKTAKKEIKKKVVIADEKEDYVNANLGASVFDAGTSLTIKSFQENIIKQKELIDENRMRYAEGNPEDLGYLERTTIHPGEIMSGFVYTDAKKADELFIKLTINGITYTYKWENIGK